MKAVAAIAAYELRRSWPVVAVALAGALGARFVPRASGDLMLVVGFAAGVICVARATGDLASPRRAFLFARPVSPVALWWGKVAAAVLLLAGCVAAPAVVLLLSAPPGRWRPLNLLAGVNVAAVLGALAGVFFGGLASRSVAVVGALAGSIALLAWQPRLVGVPIPSAFYWRAPSAEPTTLAISTVALGIVLLAGALATVRGQADGRRTAAAFATILWACLVPVLLVNGWWQWRVEAAPATRLTVVHDAVALPAGTWVAVTGGVRPGLEYLVQRLVHLPSGREHRVGSLLTASDDGRAVAWLENVERFQRRSSPIVRVAHLDEGGGIDVVDLGLSPVGRPVALALSPSATRLAMAGGGHLLVLDAATTKQVVRVPVGDVARFPLLHFASEDRLIVARGPAGSPAEELSLQLLEVDLRTRRIDVLADAVRVGNGSTLVLDRDARRLLAWQQGRARTPRADAASAGLHLFEVSGGSATPRWSHHPARTLRAATFLRDDRVAVVEADDAGGELRVFDADAGTSLQVVPLPAASTGEPFVPWRIVGLSPVSVAIEARRFPGETAAAWLVELAGGAVTPLPEGYAPLRVRSAFLPYDADVLHGSMSGLPGHALFLAPGPAIVLRDPTTGAMRPVFTMGR